MVGGTIFHRVVIQREISQTVLVLNFLWRTHPVLRTGEHNYVLTTPSLLSRGSHICGSLKLGPGKVGQPPELARAIADGARVRAFHAWTLLDNFQWAECYTERYGLIFTDFRSQKRTIKDSVLWYSRVAASNRLQV